MVSLLDRLTVIGTDTTGGADSNCPDGESLIKRADTALYESKRAGRDRVSGPSETLAQQSVDRIMDAARQTATPAPGEQSRPAGSPTTRGRP